MIEANVISIILGVLLSILVPVVISLFFENKKIKRNLVKAMEMLKSISDEDQKLESGHRIKIWELLDEIVGIRR